MSEWAKRNIRWLGVALVAISTGAAIAQDGARAKVINWSSPASSEIYVGILGEILKPGVYKLDAQSLSLQEVILRSGGLTDEASGTIRIVRQDRIVESVYFTPQSNNPLLAGDLLIVESARAQAAIKRMYEADPRDRAMYAQAAEVAIKATGTSGVQLAFVNVLDRPVVVKLRNENAQLERVMQMLDQPIELASDVRVIGPERLISQNAVPMAQKVTLSNGSVLIFPPNAINRRKLPTLPVPYDSEIATGAVPSLIGGISGQSPELRNVGQLPSQGLPFNSLPPDTARLAQPPQFEPSSIPVQPFGTATESIQIPGAMNDTPIVSSPPRIATLPFSGHPRITASTSQLTTLPGEATDKIPAPDQAQKTEPKSLMDSQDELLDDELNEVTEAPQTGTSTGQMIGIVICMGILVGAAMAIRRYLNQRGLASTSLDLEIERALQKQAELLEVTEESKPSLDATLPTAQTEEIQLIAEPLANNLWLDHLLANQLPIHEERPEFPAKITLQGRIIPPPIFRVDQAQQVPAPHLSMPVSPDSETAETTDTQLNRAIDAFDEPHESRPAGPHFLRRNRAHSQGLAAAETIGRPVGSFASRERKTSTTPVTDALRQLQGESQ